MVIRFYCFYCNKEIRMIVEISKNYTIFCANCNKEYVVRIEEKTDSSDWFLYE